MVPIAEIVAKAVADVGGARTWALLTARERTTAVYDTMRALDALAIRAGQLPPSCPLANERLQ